MENPSEFPVLINLRTKKQLDISKRSLKIGWGNGGYDIVLLGSEKGLCCEILCKGKEYTLLPFSVFATIFVNDEEVFGAAKLTHGCKLQFGETTLFKFILPSTLAPPPEKPSRYFQNAKEIDQNFEAQRDFEDGNASELEEHEWILNTQPEIDDDLLEQLQTPAQIANLASSFISRQLLLLTDLILSPQIIDQIFKALQQVAIMDDSIVLNFIKEFSLENTAGKHHQPGHSSLIKLLVDLLKFSMEPVREQVLWIRLLATLSQLPFNHSLMSKHQATAAVMGSMAVYSDLAEVQEQGCSLLAQMATYIPQHHEKAPVHQNAVDVVMLAMQKHPENPAVLGVACSVLANLIDTMSEVTSKAAQDTISSIEEAEKVVIKTLNILDYIQERALDCVKKVVENNPKDFTIQFEGSRIISFYDRALEKSQEDSHSNDMQSNKEHLNTGSGGILKKPSPLMTRSKKGSVGFSASTKRNSSTSSEDSSSLDGEFSDFSDEELNGIKRRLVLDKRSASYDIEVIERDTEPWQEPSTQIGIPDEVAQVPPKQSEKTKGGIEPLTEFSAKVEKTPPKAAKRPEKAKCGNEPLTEFSAKVEKTPPKAAKRPEKAKGGNEPLTEFSTKVEKTPPKAAKRPEKARGDNELLTPFSGKVEKAPPKAAKRPENAKNDSEPVEEVRLRVINREEYVDGTGGAINRSSGYDEMDIEGALSTIQKEEYENVFSKILEKKEGREEKVDDRDEAKAPQSELEYTNQLVKRKEWETGVIHDTDLDLSVTGGRKQWKVSNNSILEELSQIHANDEVILQKEKTAIKESPLSPFSQPLASSSPNEPSVNRRVVINRIVSLWENGKPSQAVSELCNAVPSLLVPLAEDQLPANFTAAGELTWLDTELSICSSALKSFCSDSSKWGLIASTRLLPLLERLFERFVLFSQAAESLEIIINQHGSTVIKYHTGEISRKTTKDAEILRNGYIHLSKIKVKLERIIEKSQNLDSQSEKTLQMLHEMLRPFVAKISMV